MVSTSKDPVLAVVSLSGGNDGMNTVIPYSNPRYRDYRPTLGIPEEMIVPLNDTLGLHPSMAPLKKYWDEGKLAIIQGIGYPNGSLSHFRSMDIWATCEPVELGVEGWLGRLVKELDPNKENVLTGVNFGRGPAPCAGNGRRSRRLRRRPEQLRPADRAGGARNSVTRRWTSSDGCTARPSDAARWKTSSAAPV